MSQPSPESAPEEQTFTFSDKRRIDPDTGAVRHDAGADIPAPAPEAPVPDEVPVADAAEQPETPLTDEGANVPDDAAGLFGSGDDPLLNDLKRVNAEYAAYRMRAQRDQERAQLAGTIAVAQALVPVLDEIKLAQDNGDVDGPFKVHIDKLFEALNKAGIEQFGQVGDIFDPAIHEALLQQPSDSVNEPTVSLVMQPGYRVGERIVRPARVGVAQPAE